MFHILIKSMIHDDVTVECNDDWTIGKIISEVKVAANFQLPQRFSLKTSNGSNGIKLSNNLLVRDFEKKVYPYIHITRSCKKFDIEKRDGQYVLYIEAENPHATKEHFNKDNCVII